MKKLLAVTLAVIAFFTAFSFTACSPSAEDVADEVIEAYKSAGFNGIQSDGIIKETEKTVNETVLTQTGEQLSDSENSSESETERHEKLNVASGESDIAERLKEGGVTSYNYSFVRGGYGFAYSSKKEVNDFSGIVLEASNEDVEADSADFENTLNSAIPGIAKATKALSVKGNKLKVDVNAMLYGIVSDLNNIFEKSEGSVTLGGVFADEKIKSYFSSEVYGKLTEALSSKEVYNAVAEALYIYSGGLVSIPRADTLAEIDLAEVIKDFKELTKGVTKKQFVISKIEKDIDTDDNSTVIYESGLNFSVSGAEIIYTVSEGAVTERSVSVALGVEMYSKTDTSLSYAPDKNNVKTNTVTMTLDMSESTQYLSEECALADLGEASAEYPDFVIEDGTHRAYVGFNEVPHRLYSALSESGFNFVLKTYIDKNDSVTDVVAEAYSFYAPLKSVYNKTEKSLTLSGGRLSAPLTVYLRFDKHSDADGTGVLLGVELYSTADDRDKRRLCGLKGEYFTGFPVEDGKGNYYPVNIHFKTSVDNVNEAEAVTADEKLTSLKLTGYANNVDSTYTPSSGKITVVISKTYDAPETLTFYTGVAEDNGSSIVIGLYSDSADAKTGSDRYELSFAIYRTYVLKTVRVEEYISIMNNKGDLL